MTLRAFLYETDLVRIKKLYYKRKLHLSYFQFK